MINAGKLNITNVLAEIAYRRMLHMIKRRPLDINLETITMCPHKCIFCCNRIYKREYKVMDNTLFESIVKQYCRMGGGTIGIGSMQSDFFSDPLLMDRMQIINKYKKKLWLYSTTPLISCKKYNDEDLLYILRQFDYLQVSALGFDRESYWTMSGIDKFEAFEEQIRRVKKIIDDNSLKIRIGIHFRTCDREKLRISKFYREMNRKFYIEEVRDSFFSWFGTISQGDLPKGSRLKIICNSNRKANCVVPNATLAVEADGKVVGCGCIDWLEKYVIGDCRKESLEEIWRGIKALKFRYAFQRGKLPSICKECGLYAPIDKCMKKVSLLTYKSSDGVYYLQEIK